MPAHDDSERAAVLALMRQGLGPGAIVEATGLSLRTVDRWMARWRNTADVNNPAEPILASQDERVGIRAGALLEDWIDKIEDNRDLLTLKDWSRLAGQLSITRGISLTKIEERKRGQSGTGNVQVNVILEVRERLRQELEGRATLVIDSPDTQNDPDITPGP